MCMNNQNFSAYAHFNLTLNHPTIAKIQEGSTNVFARSQFFS